MLFFDPDGRDPILYGGPGSISGPYASPPVGRDSAGNPVRVSGDGYRDSGGRFSGGPVQNGNTGTSANIPFTPSYIPNADRLSTRADAVDRLGRMFTDWANTWETTRSFGWALSSCRSAVSRQRWIDSGCVACCVITYDQVRTSESTFFTSNASFNLFYRSCDDIRTAALNRIPGGPANLRGLERLSPDTRFDFIPVGPGQ